MLKPKTKALFFWMTLSIVLSSCSQTARYHQYIHLTYSDFGPPSLAHPLIGLDYWQWDNHGDSRPKEYPIAVIVYRGVGLDQIKERFPVDRHKEKDYRYVAYPKAVTFLTDAIEKLQSDKDYASPQLLNTLIATRARIQSALGDIGAGQ